MYLAMPGITVGSRVSQEAGKQIIRDAPDDGASNPPGSGANARRRVLPRMRIFGTVIRSVAERQWKVGWDEPNYKADSNGVWETVEYFNNIRREEAGAGSGPGSPNARHRYVPGPSLPHASSTFFLPLALGRLAELLNFGLPGRRWTTTTRSGTSSTWTISAAPTPMSTGSTGTNSSARLAV